MSTYYLMDTQKSWDDDEWNGWGILSYPSPLAKYPFAFITSRNTGNIDKGEKYDGFGMGEGLTPIAATFSSKTTDVYLRKDREAYLYYLIYPTNTATALTNIKTPAIGTAEDECIRITWVGGATSGGPFYPQADIYFDVAIDPEAYGDIVAMKVYVQASIRHADQTNGIAVYIYDYNEENDDGSANAWEELSGKDGGAPRITTVDTSNVGVWGVFEETFELNGGSGGYIDLDFTSWADYIYSYREYNLDTDTGNRKQVVRIAIKGVDDVEANVGHGMNLGCVLITFIRAGTDTNQYLIADTQAPSVLTTETADISATVTASDKYVIAPSIGEIFNDIDHVTYGSNNYSFSFKDDTSDGTTVFLAYNFEDQNHFNVLQRISDYAQKIWWYDASTSVLHWGEVADLTSSGVTLSSSNIPPHAAGLSYPQEDIVWKVIAKGNKSLDLTYTKTATSDSTREVTLNLSHITSYSELKKWADNLSDKFASRQPKFHCMLDYYSDSDFHKLVPGYSVDVTWKNLSSETMTIQQTTFEWEDGERATIVVDCGIVASPLEMDIGEKFTSIHRRLDEVESMGAITDFGDPGAVILAHSTGSGTVQEVLLKDGSEPLTSDWDAGAFEIRALTFESDVTTGTAPFTIASTTVISNLNADLWDGYQFADYIDQAIKQASSPTFVGLTLSADLVTSSTIDGTDVAGLKTDVDGFADELKNLTATEIAELEAIGDVTISAGQWGYLGAVTEDIQTHMSSSTNPHSTVYDALTDNISHAEQVKAGFNVTGGGVVSVSAAYKIKWTQRFIVICHGRGAHFSTAGFFDISMPTSGTLTGVGGSPNNTWDVNGTILDGWEAIYYILPIGSNQASIAANFRICDYVSDIEIPDHWILICVKNGDTNVIRWGIGITLNDSETWTSGISSMINTDHAQSHNMASHSDEDTYNINTSGTLASGSQTITGHLYLEDSGHLYLGNGNDAYLYHTGAHMYIVNTTGSLFFSAITGDVFIDSVGAFNIRDLDDGSVTLLNLNTSARTLAIGAAADPIVTTFIGATSITGALTATSFGGITSANLVDKSVSETIGGEWTYSIFPITPSAAPDADYEVANKKYVDDEISGAGLKTDLDSLDDVTITGAVTGDIIYYNGAAWVDLARGSDGQVLTATAASINWEAAGAADNLGDHTATENLNLVGFSLIGTNFILGNAELNWLEDIFDTGVTAAEFDYLDGVTSNIQDQIDAGYVAHAMATHTDETTYNISTSGTYAFGAAAEDLDLGGFDLYGVVELRGSPDADHRIVFDPTANSMYLYPNDIAGQNYFIFWSDGTDNQNPAFFSSSTGEGLLGLTTNYWYQIYVNRLKLASGAIVDDIDTSMAASPADDQLLTAQAIKEYVNSQIRSVPSFVPYLGNGAIWNAFFCQPVIQMPSADNDCYCRFNLKIPDDWVDGSCTVKIMYSQDGANAYSVKWYVTGLEATDNWITEAYNVLNASTVYDFAAATANIIYVKSIALTDANIKAGGSLGVFCQSDANNTDELYIMEVWIEQ